MTRTFLSTAACVVLAFGCAPPAPTELSDDDRAAIRQYYDELAQNLSPEDNRAWANAFTEDAQFMVPNEPTIRGRETLYEWGEGDDSGVLLSIVLQRQPDGTWLTAAAHVSPDQPPPGN